MSKRNRGQRALYEAMSRTHAKPRRRKVLEALRPQLARIRVPSVKQVGPALERLRQAVTPKPKERVEPVRPVAEMPSAPPVVPPKVVERPEPKPVQGPSQTWLRPKRVQLNDGRIEISLPWQLGVAIGLGLILVVLIAFRLGQIDQKARFAGAQQPVRTGAPSTTPAGGAVAAGSSGAPASRAGSGVGATAGSGVGAAAGSATPPASTGDHVIVLAQYPVRTHLEPVRSYFSSQGIQTEILAVSVLRQYFSERGLNAAVLPNKDGFMLVTSGTLYENPNNSDSDGYTMKQKIVRLGAQYKAPIGYETFAPNYFSDAYGMKIR
ncbi:MAG: hypothetical protein JW741_16475 [Sedimentisphaerales bacterium]|nr:hypothetical protein [Sedimentisphaerales bacterium]